MKKLDTVGRITLPKEMRDRNNFKADDLFEIYERGDEIILKPMKKNYTISENQMFVVRKLFSMDKDTDLLEDSELATLKEICKFTDIICPKCGEPLYLANDNSYKCLKCGEE